MTTTHTSTYNEICCLFSQTLPSPSLLSNNCREKSNLGIGNYDWLRNAFKLKAKIRLQYLSTRAVNKNGKWKLRKQRTNPPLTNYILLNSLFINSGSGKWEIFFHNNTLKLRSSDSSTIGAHFSAYPALRSLSKHRMMCVHKHENRICCSHSRIPFQVSRDSAALAFLSREKKSYAWYAF